MILKKLDAQAAKVKELLDHGLGEKEITEQLQIGRATFYRMKKRLKDI
ncbi:helix-turn-helix domain-containing protein [Oribacterium sp. C9]|nr:helix-turn-helix domain-containing protein [Oribacterium sp. C9]